MYDVNPLGPLMHLKELERQAAPKLRPVQDTRHGAFSVTALATALIALVRHFRAVGIPRREARQEPL